MKDFNIQCMSEEQEEMLLRFAMENGMKIEGANEYYQRTKLKERRSQIERELNIIGRVYTPICKKEVRRVPYKITLIVEPKRFVMLVHDKTGFKMELREHGEVARLKSVWMNVMKNFVKELRRDGIHELILTFIIGPKNESKKHLENAS
ncbi:hypothetical protein [Bacillus cereus group sp. TH152-1LC]|uniref:hypothetical protein n=1 Tax=Bacillus cereus group sp. TH152-1LC TaxID=3018060 RepID=UPI0022E0D372|nr:hypothetical protein [Bacillus cereus group sp. TH152-1LC]MDA1675085.1 hypothetical protein [Bacillus cereus group sp. TH152-1LC]